MIASSFMRGFVMPVIMMIAMSLPVQAAGVRYHPQSGQKFSLIGFEGEIVHGDAVGLRATLDKARERGLPIIVTLTSEGGLGAEGMAIGRVIREYGAMTKHGRCAGSCVLAFLGGVQRFSARPGSNSSLVVYRPETLDSKLAAGAQNIERLASPEGEIKVIHDYIRDMTGSQDFYYLFINTPYVKPYAMLPSEAAQMKVVTYVAK